MNGCDFEPQEVSKLWCKTPGNIFHLNLGPEQCPYIFGREQGKYDCRYYRAVARKPDRRQGKYKTKPEPLLAIIPRGPRKVERKHYGSVNSKALLINQRAH